LHQHAPCVKKMDGKRAIKTRMSSAMEFAEPVQLG
jgi:hypothetical protein